LGNPEKRELDYLVKPDNDTHWNMVRCEKNGDHDD
jgi:hypothetical protein